MLSVTGHQRTDVLMTGLACLTGVSTSNRQTSGNQNITQPFKSQTSTCDKGTFLQCSLAIRTGGNVLQFLSYSRCPHHLRIYHWCRRSSRVTAWYFDFTKWNTLKTTTSSEFSQVRCSPEETNPGPDILAGQWRVGNNNYNVWTPRHSMQNRVVYFKVLNIV